MARVLPPSGGVEVREACPLRLVEDAPPPLTAAERAEVDRLWTLATASNPALFDGPVVLCTGLERDGAGLVVRWARARYRRFALRRAHGRSADVPALFVAVLQPGDGLLVGRMAPWTAGPGRWQLPGGSVEPPAAGEPLGPGDLARQAARELVEETGVGVDPARLVPWAVVRATTGSVGVFYRAPGLPPDAVAARFAAMTAASASAGEEPELDRIAWVRSAADLPGLEGTRIDYLEPVVRRFTADH